MEMQGPRVTDVCFLGDPTYICIVSVLVCNITLLGSFFMKDICS